MKKAIGLVGGMASGKGTFYKVLKKILEGHSIHSYSSGDIVRASLNPLYIPDSRENLIKWSEIIRKTWGADAIAQAMKALMISNPSDFVLFDGMRKWPDFETLKSIPGSIIVYVETSPEIAYARMLERKQNAGDHCISWEQFLEQLDSEPEREVRAIGKEADMHINNDGTPEEFRHSVLNFVNVFLEITHNTQFAR